MTTALSIAVAVLLVMLVRQRRAARRERLRLSQDHRHEKSNEFMRGRWDGIRYTAREQRKAKDWEALTRP